MHVKSKTTISKLFFWSSVGAVKHKFAVLHQVQASIYSYEFLYNMYKVN